MSAQTTLAKIASVEGVGLHTGEAVRVDIAPAPADSGVVFVRTDMPGSPRVKAHISHLVERPRRTALVDGTAEVQTTEHLLAALWGAGVDNAEVRLDAAELPGLDGSALPFLEAIVAAGTVELDAPRDPPLELSTPIAVGDSHASVVALPAGSVDLSVSYTLDLSALGAPSAAQIGTQYIELELDRDAFAREIAPARTFVLEEEIAQLRSEGLGAGATPENTLVFTATGVVENELRFPDECVRHKVLDLIGDLCLVGKRLRSRVIAVKSGHAQNGRLAGEILRAAGGNGRGSGAPPRARRPRRRAATGGGMGMYADRAAAEARRAEVAEIIAVAGSGLDSVQLETLIPHRFPFLLVDRVRRLEADHAIGIKNTTYNEEFFRGHFPGRPMMPGVLQVEAMAQLAGLMLLHDPANATRIALLISLSDVKFRGAVEPGDQLVLEAHLEKRGASTAQVRTEAKVDGSVVTEGRMRFMLVDR